MVPVTNMRYVLINILILTTGEMGDSVDEKLDVPPLPRRRHSIAVGFRPCTALRMLG